MLVLVFAIIVAVVILMPSIRRYNEVKAHSEFMEVAKASRVKAEAKIEENKKVWAERDAILANSTINPLAILEIQF